jgi:hypothetical protein
MGSGKTSRPPVFDAREIMDNLDGFQRATDEEMKTKEVVALLACKTIQPLIEHGYLKPSRAMGSVNLICAKSVRHFHRHHVYAPVLLKKSSDVSKLLKVSRFVGGLRLLEVPTGSRNSSMWFVRRELVPLVAIAMKYLGYVEEPRPNSPKELSLFAEGLRMTLIHMQKLDGKT